MKNDKKRWIAAGIALLVVLVSIFTGKNVEEKSGNIRTQALEKFRGMDEEVIAGTNPLQRLFVINVDGVIATDDSNDYIVDKLHEAEEDPTCMGVLLHVNSPGGSVYASERIAKEVEKLKAKGKPVYSVMQEVAASGGYYISAPCDRIYASNETFTGSIGVIMGGYSLEGLFEEYGIKEQNITSGKMKDAGSIGRDMTKEEKEYFQGLVDSAYGRFVKVVADGREMSETTVRQIADGRIYDGSQALDNGLVDKIGDLEMAYKDMSEAYNLNDPMIVEKNYYMNMFSSFFPGLNTEMPKSDLQVIQEMMKENTLTPMYLYGGYHD